MRAPDTGVAALPGGELLALCREAHEAAQGYVEYARALLAARLAPAGRAEPRAIHDDQYAMHALAWTATTVAALARLLAWAEKLEEQGRLDEPARLTLACGFGTYLAQLTGGVPMSQGEYARPADMHADQAAARLLGVGPVLRIAREGAGAAVRARIAALCTAGGAARLPPAADEGEDIALVREQVRRFADERVAPFAQAWHRGDRLIPDEVLAALGEMGVFGLTVPEAYGGAGLGKLAMCIVSEELSRGYLGVGSLGTRAEIAAELVRENGTDEQRAHWLPGIATGRVLPTAVFTEPEAGSDLASISTRAVRDGEVYRITGAKTWITHAARSDLMTLLARTGPPGGGHRGLSMFIAPKPRGSEREPFPAPGLRGSEIPVLGYRGMKEYELAFDGFAVPADGLLGGREGEGFRQLMATFESARIQTAARAVGVARNALELAAAYATERRQFGQPLATFPRVAARLGWMAVECVLARELTYHAAREKDGGRRCDIEAGMAKLLAARVAWAGADNAVQTHGGNGYSQEYPVSRVLLDARILNIFEGAAEIQANIVARGLLERRN